MSQEPETWKKCFKLSCYLQRVRIASSSYSSAVKFACQLEAEMWAPCHELGKDPLEEEMKTHSIFFRILDKGPN